MFVARRSAMGVINMTADPLTWSMLELPLADHVHAVDGDARNEMVYFSDINKPSIMRIGYNGSNYEPVSCLLDEVASTASHLTQLQPQLVPLDLTVPQDLQLLSVLRFFHFLSCAINFRALQGRMSGRLTSGRQTKKNLSQMLVPLK